MTYAQRVFLCGLFTAGTSALLGCKVSSGAAGGGGAGGEGGAGGAPAGARGAWLVALADSGTSCNVDSHQAAVGEVTAGAITKLVTNGEKVGDDKATVSCTVVDNGMDFFVEGHASVGGNELTFYTPKLHPDAIKNSPSSAFLTYLSPVTGVKFETNICGFYFEDGSPEGIQAGQMWFSFNCIVASAADDACEITTGYAAFEGCETNQ